MSETARTRAAGSYLAGVRSPGGLLTSKPSPLLGFRGDPFPTTYVSTYERSG